jgi:hypothetical protein
VPCRQGMRVTSIIGLIVGLLAVLSVFDQSRTRSLQGSLGPAESPAASAEGDKTSPARDNYIGDAACRSCHREKVDTFHQTAHYLTSRLPDKNSILGNFTPGANARTTSNPELSFRMDERENGFFQTAVQGITPYTTERTEQFGLVIGSGGKGQTYLFWKGDLLFQLPVSYWTELGWVNSPGYRDGVANFDRPIISRCLDCHATYFESISPPPNRYRKAGIVVGITCEKCHGPGREHMQRQGFRVSGSSGSAIINPAGFSRDRQMDLCAWCHAGQGVTVARTFSYLPGQPLDKYLELPQPALNAEVDVHGSQVELLEKSRCFQSSAMTCLTCHDVHTGQHDLSVFSRRCLSCHKPGTAMFPKLAHQVPSNCIDCHMPKQETNLIVFDWNGKKARPQVRSHWIRVYAAQARSN